MTQTDNNHQSEETLEIPPSTSEESIENDNPSMEQSMEQSFDPNSDLTDEEMASDNHLFKHGDILNFIRVRFPGNAKSFAFYMGDRKLIYGQKVVAMSDRGVAVGYINSFPYQLVYTKDMPPIRSILRVASEEDLVTEKDTYKKQKVVESLCIDLITKHSLDMNMTHVEFTQFGKKVVFYFTAPARVDFRGLVRDLVGELKLRIELRQISVRDRSASVGGLGPCGRQLCCSSFLGRYGNVNIKMAKNQDLTLSFNKLNGVCGQLKCCLQYEDEVYSQKRKKLPRLGQYIETYSGDRGVVERLHILSERFDLLTDRGIMRSYSIGQFKAEMPQDYRMPDRFDHIADERSNVVGLTEDQAQRAKDFEKDVEELKKRNQLFGENIFLKHFGERTTLSEEDYRTSMDHLSQQKLEEKSIFDADETMDTFIPNSEYDDDSNDEGADDEDYELNDEINTQQQAPRQHNHSNNNNNNNNRPNQNRGPGPSRNHRPRQDNRPVNNNEGAPANNHGGNPSGRGPRPQRNDGERSGGGFNNNNNQRQGSGQNRNNQGRNNR